ncbi:hypothetical protein [Sphingosinithalassobacter portus]|uniref:hypothetical protein n=1 Tax=Stakelama portus TaxID=2676234 RepID=UPI0011AB430A|nr:hypothetical protein [Sphingosinithalassobacter portus]
MTEVYLGKGSKRRLLHLGRLLGEGAAGKVHSIAEMPGSAAKIYHGEAECRRYEAKVDRMLANPPELAAAVHEGKRYPQIAWPEAKLYDKSGRFIGFVMPEIDFRRSTSLVNLLQKNSRRVEKLSDYYGYRVLVARNLASVFAELHRAGHHMIDMKPANLRFYPSVSWMAVVDTDGFSIGGDGRIPAEQVSDEYIAPESWKTAPAELGEQQDLFALAVIIFQLLDNGVHPFAGKPSAGAGAQPADLQTRILKGLYAYGATPPDDVVPSAASIHKSFRRATRTLFDRAFLTGTSRPSAAEWRDHLDTLISQLVPCASKPNEHAHFGMGCGFCAHDARITASAQKPRRRRAERAKPVQPAAGFAVGPGGRGTVPIRQLPVLTPPLRRPVRPRGIGVLGSVMALCLVLLGTMLLVPQDWWAMAHNGGVAVRGYADPAIERVASFEIPDDPRYPVDRFDGGREYLVMPGDGTLTADLRDGPGEQYPLVNRLGMHENVIGRASARGPDGRLWIWIVRESDGSPGFVQETALVPQETGFATDMTDYGSLCGTPGSGAKASLDCAVGRASGLGRKVAEQYRSAIASSRGYDRISLTENRRNWGNDLRQCASTFDPEPCRMRVNRRQVDQFKRAGAAGEIADAAPTDATIWTPKQDADQSKSDGAMLSRVVDCPKCDDSRPLSLASQRAALARDSYSEPPSLAP